jgi:hypothetical protein
MREDVVASKISAKTAYPTGRYEIDLHDATCFILFLYLWLGYEERRGGEQDLGQDRLSNREDICNFRGIGFDVLLVCLNDSLFCYC